MIDRICIGKDGRGVDISTFCPSNSHMSMFGVSGCGKTTFLCAQENNFAKAGAAVITLNCSGSHAIENDILPPGYADRHIVHDIRKSGIPFSMWGQEDDPDIAVRNLMSAFDILRLGPKQKGLFYSGLLNAYKHRPPECRDEMSYLLEKLESDSELVSVISQLRYAYGFLRVSPQYGVFKAGAITELKIDADTKSTKSIVNFLLALISSQKQSIIPDRELVLALDEYHDLDLIHQDAPIPHLLREGRKQGVSLLLATQTARGFSRQEKACINQAATQVYFRQMPEDAREVARFWANSSKEQKKLEQDLASLRVGQAIACGSFVDANGRECPRLVHISNYMPCLPSARVVAFTPSRKPKRKHTHPATADAVSSRVHMIGSVAVEVPDSNDGEEQLIHEERR